jgi:IclR family KDG regulon transcriptional repressor
MSINQSLAHGLEVLLLYKTSTLSFTVEEISNQLGYSQSKTYRLVRTLIKYGFLQGDARIARYSLGLNVLRLGMLAQQGFDISLVSLPFMKELASLTKEAVFLTTLAGTKGICLERVDSEEPIQFSSFRPGDEFPLHCGVPGKVLMAYLPEEHQEKIIEKEGLVAYTQNTITKVDKLKDNLREIKRKGWGFSDQEFYRDVRGIAAPILNELGNVIAAISIAGPAYRINKKKIKILSKFVVEYAQKISSILSSNIDKSKYKNQYHYAR